MLVFGCAILGCGGSAKDKTADKPASNTRRIIILNNGQSPFWDVVRAGMKAAEEDLKLAGDDLQAVLDPNNATAKGQIDKLRQYGTQNDIAAIGISLVDAANLAVAEEMRKLRDKGIPIIAIDSDVDREKFRDARLAFVGSDNLTAGRELGKTIQGLRPAGGKFMTFVGRTGAQNAIDRVRGVAEGAGAAFESIDNMGDDTNRTRARDNVRNAIGNHPALNVLVGIWSYNAPAIVDVVKESGRRAELTVVAFDAEQGAIAGMEEGNVDALVVQNPFEMGYRGVALLKALALKDEATIQEILPKRGEPEGDIYDTGLKVVVPDEGSPLKAEMFGSKTSFLKLGEFKQWLNKYGLKES